MKHKIISIVMLAALTLVVGACSDDKDDEKEPVNVEPAVPEYLTPGTDERPDWTAPDYTQFEFNMSLQVQLGDTLVNFQSENDLVAAFISEDVRAVTGPEVTAGEIYYPLSIAANGTDDTVILKYYCDKLHRIYTISNWATFDSSAPPTGDSGIYRPRFTGR